MADVKSCEEKHIASSEALDVRSEILKRNLKHCFPLTPSQVDNVIDLYKEGKKLKDKKKCGNDVVANLTVDGGCFNDHIVACAKCGSRDICNNPQLLRIELDEINSVPRVFYKGEEITKKVRVKFEWETDKDTPIFSSPYIDIEYFPQGENKPHSRTIGYNRWSKE